MSRAAGKAKILTDTEFNHVIAVQKSNSRTGQQNLLLLHLLLRVKEIAGLKISDVADADLMFKSEVTLTKGNKIRHSTDVEFPIADSQRFSHDRH